jgi:hypothetical protein
MQFSGGISFGWVERHPRDDLALYVRGIEMIALRSLSIMF